MRLIAFTGPTTRTEHITPFRRLHPQLHVFQAPSLEMAAEALSRKPDVLLLFGGDGTLNRYLALLVEAQVPVLAVPTGSGNDFAYANGIDTVAAAEECFKQLLAGVRFQAAADLGTLKTAQANGAPRYFSCCLNAGLDADAAARANALPDWLKSRKGYFLSGAASILRYQPQNITVSGPGISTISEEAWFVAVSNTPTFGGKLKIAPGASIADGKLDVTYVPSTLRRDLLRHFPKILTGAHTSLPFLRTFRATALHIATERPSNLYADGEFMGRTPIEVGIAPRAIQVFTRPRRDDV